MKPIDRFREHVKNTDCELCKEANEKGLIFLECPACNWVYEDEEITSEEPDLDIVLNELYFLYSSEGWSFKPAKDLTTTDVKICRVGVPMLQKKIILAFVGYGDRFFSAAIANNRESEGQRMAGSVARDRTFRAALVCFNDSISRVLGLQDNEVSIKFEDDSKVQKWWEKTI